MIPEDDDPTHLISHRSPASDAGLVHCAQPNHTRAVALPLGAMMMTMSHVVALLSSALSGGGGKVAKGGGGHHHGDSAGCCVCISRFRDGEEIRRLPCGHAFHRDCVDRWLAFCRRTCPLCRLHVGGVTAVGLDEHHQLSDDLVIWFSSLFVAGL